MIPFRHVPAHRSNALAVVVEQRPKSPLAASDDPFLNAIVEHRGGIVIEYCGAAATPKRNRDDAAAGRSPGRSAIRARAPQAGEADRPPGAPDPLARRTGGLARPASKLVVLPSDR